MLGNALEEENRNTESQSQILEKLNMDLGRYRLPEGFPDHLNLNF